MGPTGPYLGTARSIRSGSPLLSAMKISANRPRVCGQTFTKAAPRVSGFKSSNPLWAATQCGL